MDRTLKFALASLVFNMAFATYHLVMGLVTRSWWLLTLGSYYLVLSVVRFVVLHLKSKEHFIIKFTGWMLMLLSIPLVGTVILSVVRDRGHKLHMIVMIAMAAYAFTKITLAIIKLIKARRSRSATLITLRNISLADGFVSIFALQRSMLVSFEGMSEAEIVIMNAALGSALCIACFLLGLFLLLKQEKVLKTKLKTSNNFLNTKKKHNWEILRMKIIQFFKNAFADMKASTKAQHKVDKANLAAAKAEAKAQWEEAKMSPKARQAKMQEEREKQIAEANERKAIADERIIKAKESK